MDDTRTSNKQTDAWSPCDIAISCRCIATSLFVAEPYESNAKIDCMFCYVSDWKTNQTKDDSDFKIVQALSNDFGSQIVGHLGNDMNVKEQTNLF